MSVEQINKQNRIKLLSYDWPGNIRELQNIVERAVITSENGKLNFEIALKDSTPDQTSKKPSADSNERILTAEEIQQIERDNIIKALEATDWKGLR